MSQVEKGSALQLFSIVAAQVLRPAATEVAPLDVAPPGGVNWVVGLVEQAGLGRRTARRPPGSFWLGGFRTEVGEDLLNHFGVLDASDDPHRPTAGPTGLDGDAEHPFQALRPPHLVSALDGASALARHSGRPGS